MEKTPLNRKSFRKMSFKERRKAFFELTGSMPDSLQNGPLALFSLADIMVENAVGIMAVPLGLACGFLIDGSSYDIPMATEEPSVIAAASYSAGVISSTGGFTSWASEPVMTCQVFFPYSEKLQVWLHDNSNQIRAFCESSLESLERRGGGYRGHRVSSLESCGVLLLEADVNVADAMGANRLNSLAENIARHIHSKTGEASIMAILSNESSGKRARASFRLPLKRLARLKIKGRNEQEKAERIVLANRIACENTSRAVTHNKGIMNGINALALATGNDTRAIEAAIHAWASRSGCYRALTEYRIDSGCLEASIEMPAPFAVTGGACNFHPTAKACLALLGTPGAPGLSRIATALGLAQNFAALMALTGPGIQAGHLPLHSRKSAGNTDKDTRGTSG